jgi:hypothetical protein
MPWEAGLIAAGEIAGAVTVVVKPDGIVHLEPHGVADLATQHPMATDTVFWIASMTKPVTGVAVAMLIDDGLLAIDDPVDRYVPALEPKLLPAPRHQLGPGNPRRVVRAGLLIRTRVTAAPSSRSHSGRGRFRCARLRNRKRWRSGRRRPFSLSLDGVRAAAFADGRNRPPSLPKHPLGWPTWATSQRIASASRRRSERAQSDHPTPPPCSPPEVSIPRRVCEAAVVAAP